MSLRALLTYVRAVERTIWLRIAFRRELRTRLSADLRLANLFLLLMYRSIAPPAPAPMGRAFYPRTKKHYSRPVRKSQTDVPLKSTAYA